MPNVLVTGASSGFGTLITQTLVKAGHTVFATMRDPGGRNEGPAGELVAYAAANEGTVHVLPLDVTDERSVKTAVAKALELGDGIDIVVNNAGLGGGGFAEGFTTEQWQKLFDVNVFGVQRVNRAVLPSMRARGRGLVVFVSSVMGRIVLPFSAPYTASKWALEGMAETYRYELAGTGVDVAIVEPGGFMTAFAENMFQPADEDRVDSYGPLKQMPEQMWGGFIEQLGTDGPDPQIVADAVQTLIDTPAGRRPLRTVVDPFQGGEGPNALNQASDGIQTGMFTEFGMPEILRVPEQR